MYYLMPMGLIVDPQWPLNIIESVVKVDWLHAVSVQDLNPWLNLTQYDIIEL